MARSFKPLTPFDVAMKLLKPTTTMVKGVAQKSFPNPESVDAIFFGSFKTYGGTENFSNDVYMVFDTAKIETWYNPEITADCEIYICETGQTYQIVNEPENINMRHQFMQIKVEKVGGKP